MMAPGEYQRRYSSNNGQVAHPFMIQLRKFAAKHAAERPLVTLLVILLLTSCALPLVIVVSLYPLVLFSSSVNSISEFGIGSIFYYVLMQGSSLLFLVATLSASTYSGIVGMNIFNVIANSSFVQKKLLKK